MGVLEVEADTSELFWLPESATVLRIWRDVNRPLHYMDVPIEVSADRDPVLAPNVIRIGF